jgi:pimeloyl-ACP methyl ester carboxylesterase
MHKYQYININNHNIAYTEWGESNNKNIICLHSLIRNSRDFDFLAKKLAKYYHVYALDMIGRGKSEYVDDYELYQHQQYVSDVLELINQKNLEQVTLIGSSMGGLISIYLAAEHPELIERIIINDVGPFIPKEPLQRIAQYVPIEHEFEDLNQLKEHYKQIYKPFNINNEEHWDQMVNYGFDINERGKYTPNYDPKISVEFASNDIEKFEDFDIWACWEKIKCPILVIRGALSDILTFETFITMIKSKSQCEGFEYEDTGHTPSLMEEMHIKDIEEWLRLTTNTK